MQKLINSQVIYTNGWQSINFLASMRLLLLVLFWLPASLLEGFKYSKNNYYSAGDAKRFLLGVRENEQPKKAKNSSGKFGCLFARTRKSKSKQTTDLSTRSVVL